jgi:hypothetical protein
MKIGVGGRAAAMGGACVAVCDDVSSMFLNPARLIKSDKAQVMAQYGMWIADTRYNVAGFAKPIIDKTGRTKSILGIGVTYFDSGKIRLNADLNDAMKLDSELTPKDFFYTYGLSMSVTYSKALNDSLSLGYAMKIIGESIAERSMLAFAADAGVSMAIGNEGKNSAGIVLQNLGTPFNDSELPMVIKAGSSFQVKDFLLAVDLVVPNDHAPRLDTGFEFRMTDMIRLRGGYVIGSNEAGLDNQGLSAGMGLKAGDLLVDFAFVPAGILGDTYRTSIIVKF